MPVPVPVPVPAILHLFSFLSVRSKEGSLVLPSVGYQHVSEVGPEEADADDDDEDDDEYQADVEHETKLITVDLENPQPASEQDLMDKAFTTGSAMIDSEDVEVGPLG